MRRLALRIERDANRYGWDEEPEVFAIYGGQLGSRNYRRRFIHIPQHILEVQPLPVALRAMGVLMRRVASGERFPTSATADDLVSLRKGMAETAADNFAGYGVCVEAWMNRNMDQVEDTDKPLADIVGSEEIRAVYIADVGGRMTAATRVRGEAPEAWTFGHGRNGRRWHAAGRLANALRDWTYATAVYCRPDMVDLPAIEKMCGDDTDDH